MQCPKCGEPIMLVKADLAPIYDIVQKRRVYVLVTLYACVKCKGKSSFKEDFQQPDKAAKLPDEVFKVIKDADETFKWFDDQHKDEKVSMVILNKVDDGEETNEMM